MNVPRPALPQASRSPLAVAIAAAFLSLAFVPLASTAPLPVQITPVSGDIAVSQPDGDYERYGRIAADHKGGWGATWEVEISRLVRYPGPAVSADSIAMAVPFGESSRPRVRRGRHRSRRRRRGCPRRRAAAPGARWLRGGCPCVDPQGAPRGPRVRVDAGPISSASRGPSNVRVATASDGTSVVVWQETPGDHVTPPSVFFRRLLADCTPTGNVGSLGAVGVVGRRDPEVALRPDGGFVLAFVEGEATDNLKIAAQQFDAGGVALAPSFLVSQGVVRQYFGPGVAVAS